LLAFGKNIGNERQDPKNLLYKNAWTNKKASNTANNHRVFGMRGRFNGVRKIGTTKPMRSAPSGWQPNRKSTVNRIALQSNRMVVNNIGNTNIQQYRDVPLINILWWAERLFYTHYPEKCGPQSRQLLGILIAVLLIQEALVKVVAIPKSSLYRSKISGYFWNLWFFWK
jgi:hypothetical protein